MIKLIIKKNGKTVIEKELGDQALTVGSSKGCDIVLKSDNIGQEHATISLLGGKVLIENSSSKSTLVNNSEVTTSFLDTTSKVKIGEYTIELLKDDASVSDNSLNVKIEKQDPAKEEESSPDYSQTIGDDFSSFTKRVHGGEEKTEFDISQLKDTDPTIAEIESRKEKENEDTIPKINPDFEVQDSSKTIVVDIIPGPRLFALNGPLKGNYYEIKSGENILGRNPDVEISIDEKSVSSVHAALMSISSSVTIVDKDSTNGTKINGKEIRKKILKCHDIVETGDQKFEFLEGNVSPLGSDKTFKGIDAKDFLKEPLKNSMEETGKLKLPLFKNKRLKLYLYTAVFLVLLYIAFPVFKGKGGKITLISPDSTDSDIVKSESEKERIILHNLNLAKNYFEDKQYERSKEKLLLILKRIDDKNTEALELLRTINRVEKENKEKILEENEKQRKKNELIDTLLAEAKKASVQDKFDTALSKLNEILKIDSENKQAKDQIAKTKRAKALYLKERETLKKKLTEIESLFYQGISFYEEGNFDEAALSLRKVADFKSSKFYKNASAILKEIEDRQLADIEDQLNEVNNLIKSEEVLKAKNILRSILKRFPKSKKARDVYERVHKELVEKAKKLYGEALVYEQVVEDVNSAMENYEEILRLLPEEDEEYHMKAKARLNKLK